MALRVRTLGTGDAHILREYLQLAISMEPGAPPLPDDLLERPQIACYVDDWGRYGDDGVLALDESTRADVGAAWLRLWPGLDTGYGFVDRATPELAIAVRPERRGQGIGTCLLDALLDRAAPRFGAVSLSVSIDNPAVALYQRFGFRAIAESHGTLLMRRTFAGSGH